jgi:DNA polymerase V
MMILKPRKIFTPKLDNTKLSIPFFIERISAGFPSPASDYAEHSLDLNELCIQNPISTFFVRVTGTSMIDAGILPNDVLIVDRSLAAKQNDVVIACVQGEFTVKQLQIKPTLRLLARNQHYAPIEINEASDLQIFGVVTHVVHAFIPKHQH